MKVKKKTSLIVIISLVFIIVIASAYFFFSGRVNFTELYTINDIIKGGKAVTEITRSRINDYIDSAQYNINIVKYDINVELFPVEKSVSAEVKVKGVIKHPVENIVLNFYNGYKISDFTLNGNKAEYNYSGNYLKIPSSSITDTFLVEMTYSGKPENPGFGSFSFNEVEGVPIVYTLNEPIYASVWYPCNDMPSDKALFAISIKNDSNYVSISNGKLDEIVYDQGRKIYKWSTNYPMSTYLACIYSGPYESFTDTYSGTDTLDLEYYVYPGNTKKAMKDFKINKKILNTFEELFGPYPFYEDKYGIAEITWPFGAIEHQTISGVGSTLISGSGLFDDYYIHELAHHWWGNAVGPASWKDIWLNEGFSSYSEALYYEFNKDRSALVSTMLGKRGDFIDTRLYDPEGYIFSETVYDKGAWVLHMLRREMGEDVFFGFLKAYYDRYKYKNVSTSEFENFAGLYSGKNLNKFFDQWLNRDGIPEILYSDTTIYNGNEYIKEITFKQNNGDSTLYDFPLDIRYEYSDGEFEDFTYRINSKMEFVKFKSKNKVEKIIPDPKKWLLARIVQDNSPKL